MTGSRVRQVSELGGQSSEPNVSAAPPLVRRNLPGRLAYGGVRRAGPTALDGRPGVGRPDAPVGGDAVGSGMPFLAGWHYVMIS